MNGDQRLEISVSEELKNGTEEDGADGYEAVVLE